MSVDFKVKTKGLQFIKDTMFNNAKLVQFSFSKHLKTLTIKGDCIY